MNLYFSPLACSLATRISLYEAGAPAEFSQVDLKTKRVLNSGRDFAEINPLTQVPVLEIDDRTVLKENTAILQYVADQLPEAKLAPTSKLQRARMQEWLSFISTELHKSIFNPLLNPTAAEAVKEYSRARIPSRFALLQDHFATHEFLLDRFSVADAYLTTILNWAALTGVDLTQWPAVNDYFQRMTQRPQVARAMKEELALFQELMARQAN